MSFVNWFRTLHCYTIYYTSDNCRSRKKPWRRGMVVPVIDRWRALRTMFVIEEVKFLRHPLSHMPHDPKQDIMWSVHDYRAIAESILVSWPFEIRLSNIFLFCVLGSIHFDLLQCMWNLIKKIAPYFKLFRLIKHHVLLFRENLHPMDIDVVFLFLM